MVKCISGRGTAVRASQPGSAGHFGETGVRMHVAGSQKQAGWGEGFLRSEEDRKAGIRSWSFSNPTLKM